jgi:putative transposase
MQYPACVKRSFKFRFYPTPEQASELNRTFGCIRMVWNKALAERHSLYATEKKSITYAQMGRNLTAWKQTEELGFLREVSSVPLQQTLRHQQVAFNRFFAKQNRYPRFKNRNRKQSAEYTRNGFRWKNEKLFLAKMSEPLDLRLSRPVPEGEPTIITVSRDMVGRWHVSMMFDDTVEPLPKTGAAVGIDLGLKDFLVTSDGERINHPQYLRKKEQRLARYQRMMARKVKGSTNRVKAKKRVAKTHAAIADSRKDFLHKVSTDIVRKYDVIAVEDLAVKNMVKNRSLAKSISDSGWGEFRSMLEYKADWYGKRFVIVDRFYPSSKTCFACGHLLKDLSLRTRRWTCPGCRTLHDRDVNAAKNILAEGLSVTGFTPREACGAGVSHLESPPMLSAVKQETVDREVLGIPSH